MDEQQALEDKYQKLLREKEELEHKYPIKEV